MSIKNSMLGEIKYKQWNWYGHMRRMEEERLPKEILDFGVGVRLNFVIIVIMFRTKILTVILNCYANI